MLDWKRFIINQQSTFMCGLLVRLLKQLEGAHSATQDSLQYEKKAIASAKHCHVSTLLVPNWGFSFSSQLKYIPFCKCPN